jgi:hypothetical protein
MHSNHQPAALVLLCCALALIGCASDTEAGPTNPSAAPAGDSQLQAIGSQQRVTGVAFITLPDDPNQNKQRVSFSAGRRQDGSVRGRLKLSSTQNFGADPDSVRGLRFHASITCLGIEGTTARLGGFVTKSFHPFVFEGEPWTMMVVDRGKGGASPRDLTTDLSLRLFPNEVEEFCAGIGEPGTLVEIERGNIQVRP